MTSWLPAVMKKFFSLGVNIWKIKWMFPGNIASSVWPWHVMVRTLVWRAATLAWCVTFTAGSLMPLALKGGKTKSLKRKQKCCLLIIIQSQWSVMPCVKACLFVCIFSVIEWLLTIVWSSFVLNCITLYAGNREFIEQRKKALKRFINIMARHPQIYDDKLLKFFLTFTGNVGNSHLNLFFRRTLKKLN